VISGIRILELRLIVFVLKYVPGPQRCQIRRGRNIPAAIPCEYS